VPAVRAGATVGRAFTARLARRKAAPYARNESEWACRAAGGAEIPALAAGSRITNPELIV